MTKTLKILTPAEISWHAASPVSESYDDFYFSTDNGLQESRYVFLQANGLPEAFTEAPFDVPLIIAETGFGTGLNFLATWAAWLECPSPKRPLHFFSVEKFPLKPDDLMRALSCWPELATLSSQLTAYYPSLINGLHSLDFEHGQVRLNLLFGDVTEIAAYPFKADIWYLDGFSPKKNPDMWGESIIQLIALHSKPGTRLSTFTAASDIRKRLQHEGFNLQKRPGFGVKREMLFGEFCGRPTDRLLQADLWSLPSPGEDDPLSQTTEQSTFTELYDVAIIGAGLAGLATAFELSRQGLKICLIDSESAPVQGASGQSQLAMYAKLPSEANKLFHFTVHALNDSMRFYTQLQAFSNPQNPLQKPFWHPVGLMQLAWNEKEKNKQRQFLKNIQLPEDIIHFIDAETAKQLSGLDTQHDALWMKQAGWLDPIAYAKGILTSIQADTFFNYTVEQLELDEATRHWHLRGSNQRVITSKAVVIANANSAKRFAQCAHLPSKPLRGQVTSIKHKALHGAHTVICGEGYLCPAVDGWHHFGATFDLKNKEAEIREDDTRQNIQSLQNWLPGWLDDAILSTANFEHSAGLRCTTPDYLPIVGPAPIADKMIETFGKLRVDSNACKSLYGHYYPGLFLNIGHGSKGLFTSPIAAKIIRAYLCGGLPACSEEQRKMLSPARFLIKHLIQRRI